MSHNQPDDFAKICGAAHDGNDEVMRAFLNAGINIDAFAYGKSSLHMAICNSSPEIVDFLLRHGADPRIKTSAGNGEETALELAVSLKRWHIIPLLENKIREMKNK